MDPTGIVTMWILGGLVSWLVIGRQRERRERRRARRILRTSPVLTAESPEGHTVRATGVVSLGEHVVPLRSKLCAKACVIYRTRILSRDWALLRARVNVEMKTIPFILDCGANGRLEVVSDHAILDLEPTLVPFQLRRGNHVDVDYDSEQAVEVGTTVTVAGVLTKTPEMPTTELGYRDMPSLALRLTGSARHPITMAPGPTT